MGDSYASGMGSDVAKSPVGVNAGNVNMSKYDAATTTASNKCYRSVNAYGPRIAADKGLSFKFAACSGATIPQVIDGLYNEPSQLSWLSSSTKYVTVSAGGNDTGFINVFQCIVTKFDCTSSDPIVTNAMSTLTNVLPGRYDDLLQRIKAAAPNAKIIMVGYATTLPNQVYQDPYMSAAEKVVATNLRNGLNAAMQSAAQRNGATYIDPFAAGSPFNRTDASAGNLFPASAFWAIRLEIENLGSSYHPTLTGQTYYKQLVQPALS